MKKITRIVPVVLGALALASCSSDEMFSNAALEATQAEGDQMIAVVDENPDAVTRYGFDNESTMNVWSTGDTYTVFDQSLVKAANYTLVDGYSGSKAGLFEVTKGKDVVDEDNKSTARYGVFPYRADNVISFADFAWTLYMTLPAEHAYEKITNQEKGDLGTKEAAVAPLPLWGAVTNEEGSRKISFKMMTSLLKVDLSSIPAGYQTADDEPAYLLVTSKNHKLNGRFKVDITKQTDAEYSGEVGDVELVKDGDPTGTEKEIKVTFKTDGSKILNRVFYIPIPVGTYEAGDLEIKLYDGDDNVKDNLTPEAWKTSEVKFERARAKTITYTINMEITANSIHELNNNIRKELNNLKAIKEGDTFTFTVSGGTLTPTADDNMLLIPTFGEGDNKKNINVILNIKNKIDASGEALNIAEAAYGDESTSVDGQWKLKSDKTPNSIKNDAKAAQRTFTVNLGYVAAGTVTSNSNVNVLAPTSKVYLNTTAVDNTIDNIEATTANEDNSLQLGVEDGKTLTCIRLVPFAGGAYIGTHASVGVFSNQFSHNNFNVYGVVYEGLVKWGNGKLFIDKNAHVTELTNYGSGDVIVDGHLYNAYPTTYSLKNNGEATITINGSAQTVILSNNSKNPFIAGPGASITKLTTAGSGDIFVQGASVGTITNNGSGAITVEGANGENPVVESIYNGENGKDVSVTANKSNLTIKNDSKTANLVVEFEKGAAYTATLTDNSGVMTADYAQGGMTVKNTSGLVTLTNIGGAVVLENCSGNNVIDNDVQNGAITLNGSYAATLTNSNSTTTATVKTSGQAGIGTATPDKFTFVDAAWDGSSLEYRNVSGNIYTAAQLAALTQSATTESTITLKTSINLGNHANSWAGIKQGTMTIFDGKNFTISNLNLNRPANSSTPVLSGLDADKIGLFATAGANKLTIQNLKLDNVAYATTDNKNCIGALVGEFNGANDFTVENVIVSNVNFDAGNDATQSNSVAALVGKFTGNDLKFSKTKIEGASTIKGTSSLAGFVGNLGASNNVEFDACKLSGLTITVQGTPANAVAGRVGYLIGGVSGAVANLNVSANLEITPATLTNDQRVAWKYKRRKQSETIFFWGDSRGYLGYCDEGKIGSYLIGTETQKEGVGGTYNLYEGY